jgi:hypothetical protein
MVLLFRADLMKRREVEKEAVMRLVDGHGYGQMVLLFRADLMKRQRWRWRL